MGHHRHRGRQGAGRRAAHRRRGDQRPRADPGRRRWTRRTPPRPRRRPTIAAASTRCGCSIVLRRHIDAPVPRLDAEVADRRPARPGRGGRAADVRPAGAARRVGHPAAARAGRAGRHLVVRRDRRSDRLRPARACSPTAGSPTSSATPTRPPRCSSAPTTTPRATPTWPGPGITPWRAALAAAFDTASSPADVGDRARQPERPVRAAAGRLAVAPGWASRSPVEKAEGKYIVGGRRSSFEDGQTVQMTNEGYKLVMRRPGQPDSIQPFPQRTTGDLLAEELRRLDADQPYAEALGAVTGLDRARRPLAVRTHIWHDPALARSRKADRWPRAGVIVVEPTAESWPTDVAARVRRHPRRGAQHARGGRAGADRRARSWSRSGRALGRHRRPRRCRLVPGGRVLGRRALRPGRLRRPQRRPGEPHCCSAASPFKAARLFTDAGQRRRRTRRPRRRRGWPTPASSRAARRPDDADEVPNFDVVLLGRRAGRALRLAVPRATPAPTTSRRSVIAVRNSPKPPPLRLSLTFAGAGRGQRDLVRGLRRRQGRRGRAGLSGAGPVQVPAAGARAGSGRSGWSTGRPRQSCRTPYKPPLA